MCDYCGCQSVEAIAQLTREHDDLRSVARAATDAAHAADRSRAVEAIVRLLTMLAPHTEIEERGLFPALAADHPDHVASLRADHRELEHALTAIAAETTAPDWVARLDAAAADLFTHILREQDGLFPASLSILAPRDWDALDEIRAQVAARAPTTVP